MKDIHADISEFDPAVFDDPIKLLAAIEQYERQVKNAEIVPGKHQDLLESEKSNTLSLDSVVSKYYLSKDQIMLAVKNNQLQVAEYIPCFYQSDIERFLREVSQENSPLYTAFLNEVENMRIQYSYKPVLWLALFHTMNEKGSSTITEIGQYFLSYYRDRKARDLVVEKEDSMFVQYPENWTKALQTIIKYPLAIYCKKGFLSFDMISGTVSLSPCISCHLTDASKVKVIQLCNTALENYYSTIS